MTSEPTPCPGCRDPHTHAPAGPSRRRVVAGATVGGLAAALLAACSSDGSSSAADSGSSGDSGGSGGSGDSGGSGGTTGPLAPTSDIPEGGGEIFADANVVVTQPSAGQFKAFDATCTHAGCTVGSVSDVISCPCHGSQFSIEDGSVVQGPASDPLPEVPITVEGDQVVLG